MLTFERARWLALLVPTALLGGALGSQYWGGLYPCEMCYWQRYPHGVAMPARRDACRFEDVGMGVFTNYSGSTDYYIADSVFLGRNDQVRTHDTTTAQ